MYLKNFKLVLIHESTSQFAKVLQTSNEIVFTQAYLVLIKKCNFEEKK